MTEDYVIIRPLGRAQMRVVLPKKGTMRDFMLSIAPQFGNAVAGDSFQWTLVKNNVGLNTFENRDVPLRDLIQPDDVLFSTLWVLSPTTKYRNNLAPPPPQSNSRATAVHVC